MPKLYTSKDVLLFIPNLIGYTRVFATFFSFFVMIFIPDQWLLAIASYIYSFTADLFDGMAARRFNQSSNFGGLLDMITDRCSTLGLLFILYGEYGTGETSHAISNDGNSSNFPWYRALFLLLAILDISSHWCQMYSTASLQIHHKSIEGNSNRFFLVQWYYQCYPFFGYCCVSAELTYVALYGLHHLNMADATVAATTSSNSITRIVVGWLLKLCVPGCAMKQIVNIFQLTTSCHAVAKDDALQKNKSL